MHEDDVAAAGTHAARMLEAMQLASQAFAARDYNDTAAVLRELRQGTALRAAISDYVAQLKRTGLSPEQFLVAAKQSVAQFERIPQQIEARPLMEGVISVCIEEYYRT